MQTGQNNTTHKQEVCALLGNVVLREGFMTTADAISQSSKKEIPALFKPKKLLGDYTVSAGEVGTPELTQNYLKATKGVNIQEALNTIINKNLKESSMDTTHTTDNGGQLKSFDEFPVGRSDLDDVAIKAATPVVVTLDFRGNVIHKTLLGTRTDTPKASTTVEMNSSKERALKRMAEFVSSFHGNNQQSMLSKG